MPLPAVPAVFRGVSCRRLPLGGYATFLAPVACPAPAVELCLLGLRCLWCVAWFSTLCHALPPGPAVCTGCPWGFLPLLTPPAFPCVVSASPTPAGLQGFAGVCTLCQGAPIGVVTALWVTVWWCLLALIASRAWFVVQSSPPAVLDLCGGCALFTACLPLP